MKTKVKICGIRSLEQAIITYEAGADFLGLQFVPTSKRRIDLVEAKKISVQLKGKIKLVGVFQNQPLDDVNKITQEINFDYVQLHGNEDLEFCRKVTVPMIKSFRLPADFNVIHTIDQMKKYPVDYFLIDREKRGEGEMLSLKKSKTIAKEFSIFFAGGLNPENVSEVVKTVHPYAVDVALGIETNGIPDQKKIRLFIQNAKK